MGKLWIGGGLGVEERKREKREKIGGGCIYSSVETTTMSTTEKDETHAATCQNTSPHDEEEFLTHLSFACVQLAVLQILLG